MRQRLKQLKLDTRLTAVCVAVVLLLSVGHFFVYSQLLHTVQQEQQEMVESSDQTQTDALPLSETEDMLRSSLIACVVAAVVATGLILLTVPASVRRLMQPVNKMLALLRPHGEQKGAAAIAGACEELEQILKLREEQEAALAQQDAALSEYFLQSRLKNVYVDLDRQALPREGVAFILYIQVHYYEKTRSCLRIPREKLENMLQEMMSGTLSSLFETTMVFQLEPGRFAARVTLAPGDHDISDEMARFMTRLEQEKEFAWFTVVQSEMLMHGEDLAAVYNRVQDAARQALVCDHSQLLKLSDRRYPERDSFAFSKAEEKMLHSHLCAGQIQQAVALAEQILEENLCKGITRAQMEILCVGLVNTAVRAITEVTEGAGKIAAASGVYNVLTGKCTTATEYKTAVTEFIRTIAASEMRPAEDDQLLGKVQKFLQENYQREFSSEEMASALWVSRSYLSTYYKSKTGMNLSDSIQLYRVQKAVELLKDPDVKIGDVGAMVGMPSSNTFLRQFKKYTGMTPKEFRLQKTE